jgi:bifunctional non-homologous end joining protein LigD
MPGIAAALRALPVESITLDGEAVCVREDGRDDFLALRSPDQRRRARLVAFDVMEMDGKDLRPLFFDARRVFLEHVLAKAAGHILLSETMVGPDGPAMFRAACQLGLEGVISKKRSAPYRSGRSPSWVKSKSSSYQR